MSGNVRARGGDWQSCASSGHHVEWVQSPEWWFQTYKDTVELTFSGLVPGVDYRVYDDYLGSGTFRGDCLPPVVGQFSAVADYCHSDKRTCEVRGAEFVPKTSSVTLEATFRVDGQKRLLVITGVFLAAGAIVGCIAGSAAGPGGCAAGAILCGAIGLFAGGLWVSMQLALFNPTVALVSPYAVRAVPVAVPTPPPVTAFHEVPRNLRRLQ